MGDGIPNSSKYDCWPYKILQLNALHRFTDCYFNTTLTVHRGLLECGWPAGGAHCGPDLKCRIMKKINSVMTDEK